MMQDGSQLTMAARLAAIEYMIGHLYKVMFRASGATPEMIEKSFQQFREQLKKETYTGPGIHPTQSDMAAAEVEEAFDHLLDVIAEMVGVAQKSKD
jgi:hypothetical protein